MYIYAIDRMGDAAYKCNGDATRDPTLTLSYHTSAFLQRQKFAFFLS